MVWLKTITRRRSYSLEQVMPGLGQTGKGLPCDRPGNVQVRQGLGTEV